MLCSRLPQRLRWGSGGGFKGTGCKAPRERHCKRKNVPRRREPLGRKSVIADIMSVRRQVTNEERALRGASQKTYIAEDRQQRALSPWCMDRQECAPTFPLWENAGAFSVADPAGHSPWNGGGPAFFLHMDKSSRDGFSSRLLSIRAGGAKALPPPLFLWEGHTSAVLAKGALLLFPRMR
jgi:hypothetical protein